MSRTRKTTQELLMPGASVWERWAGPAGVACVLAAEFAQGAGVFSKEAVSRRILALPLTQVWVLPAWLHGEAAHLRDMAALHLERLGVTVTDLKTGLQLRHLQEKDGAHLVCITALKETSQPLWDPTSTRLPDETLLSADCLPLPANAMVICREREKLVLMITHGAALVYASPLTAHHLDAAALGEVNHICVQLGFQGVLGQVQGIHLWLPEGEGVLSEVQQITGLPAVREPRPAPVMPQAGKGTLVPPEIQSARAKQASAARTRVLALTSVCVLSAAIAMMTVLISLASQERDRLRERVAQLTPQASQVLDRKRAWLEAAPATDPTRFPMQTLLDCMQPKVSEEVSMVHFEWTPERVLLRGRTPSPALALQYSQEIKSVEPLQIYTWETPPPDMASDDSATFELRGGLKP